MQFRRTPKFKEDFNKLPNDVQELVKKRFLLFQENPYYPYHPSLRIKPMQGYKEIWEGHITLAYVFTFHREKDPTSEDIIIFFRRIGRHDIYKNP